MSHTSVVLARRYRLDERIAAGGMGEVWRGLDVVLGRPVAVKLLRAEYTGQAETLARFRAEARHAGSLSHPGIAQVYDYCEDEPPYPPYLVMELVDGPSLAEVLAGGPLDPWRAMDVIAQAAAGLAAAHAAGVVHRDIKPANLLLRGGNQVKITDFGIAHVTGSAPLTRAGLLTGTPAYLAPERVAGAPATPAADLYALGVVAYECLAGVPPFTGEPMQVAAAHRDQAMPPLPPGVPAGVAGLVADLTAKEPAARPARAAEVAQRAARLRDAMTGQVASPPGFGAAAPVSPADTLVEERPVTFDGTRGHGGPLARWRGRMWTRRGVAVALVAGVVAAGLAGWLLANVVGARDGPARPTPTFAAASPPSAGQVAEVSASQLVGQPVGTVRQQLRQLGLRVQVVWQHADGQPPGTVVSVQPTGQVPVGSTVVVTVAGRPHGHGPDGGGDGG